jgi:fermentation-respiration switch protein FrsA (DUF1100 family)
MAISRRRFLSGAVAGGAVAGLGMVAGCGDPSTAAPTADGSTPVVTASTVPPVSTSITEAVVQPLQLYASPLFNDEALFNLGAASSHTAEVGEVVRIAQDVNQVSGNPTLPTTATFDAYYDGYGNYGDPLAQMAEQDAGSHPITAQHRYFRASNYACQQLFFVLGTSDGSREEAIYDTCAERFDSAVALWQPKVEQFRVNSPFGSLPGYFFPASTAGGRRPTIIISSGSDGQEVESMQFGVTGGLARGYNVVLFEGPGQMRLLFKRNVPFTPNWYQVVGPVLDWVKARDDVGKVGLIGVSFAGMLCASPAARLKDLDAVVLEPAAWNLADVWGDQASMKVVKASVGDPPAQKAIVQKQLNAGFLSAWPTLPRPEQFEIYKRGEIITPQVQAEARAGQPVSNYYGLLERMLAFDYSADLRAITIPTLMTVNEGDDSFANQPYEAFAMLSKATKAKSALIPLTAAQGAQLHDQPSGPQVADEFIFDWLDDQLR